MPEKKFMSLDEYLTYKADSTRNAAYEKSMARNKGIEIVYPLTKERKEKNERTIAQFLSGTKQPDSVKQRAEANYIQALKELENNCEYGLNCIGTGLDNYPIESRTHVNKDFTDRHNSLGFKEIELKDALPGDIVQAVNERGPFHGMIFAGWDDKGRPTFNYSSGGIEPGHYVKQGIYNVPDYWVYRYEGTPELIQQWTNEYNKNTSKNTFKYGGEVKEPKFAKDLVKAGLSFIPGVGTIIDGYDLYKDPSWKNAGYFVGSLASDVLGLTAIKGLAKTAKTLKAVETVAATKKAATASKYAKLASKKESIDKLNNARKSAKAAANRGRAYYNDLVSNKQLLQARVAADNAEAKFKLASGANLFYDGVTQGVQLMEPYYTNHNDENQKKLGGMKKVRQKKFIGAVIGAVGTIASSVIQSQQQKKLLEAQQKEQRIAQNQANFNTYLQNASELANVDNSWVYDKFKPAFRCGGKKRMKAELGKYKARFNK